MKTYWRHQLIVVAALAGIVMQLGCCERTPIAGTLSPVPAKYVGTWFNGDWGRGDKGERITLNTDWTFERYLRFDTDSTAIGKFFIRDDDTVILTPKYYAVDAKRCGGSSEREFTFATKGGTTCLIQLGTVYWKNGRPPRKVTAQSATFDSRLTRDRLDRD